MILVYSPLLDSPTYCQNIKTSSVKHSLSVASLLFFILFIIFIFLAFYCYSNNIFFKNVTYLHQIKTEVDHQIITLNHKGVCSVNTCYHCNLIKL